MVKKEYLVLIAAFVLMAVMMTGGILMRTFHWIPDRCTAMFYTGLGGALTCAASFFGHIYTKFFAREERKNGSGHLQKLS